MQSSASASIIPSAGRGQGGRWMTSNYVDNKNKEAKLTKHCEDMRLVNTSTLALFCWIY